MPHVIVLESDLAVLVVIDVQEKLMARIESSPPDDIVDKVGRLIGAARLLNIPIMHTEQYPDGLGPTDTRVKKALPEGSGPMVKSTCSCWRDEAFRKAIQATGREHVILAGVETHVCIQQTALDMIRVDYASWVAVDAVGSRRTLDHETALARLGHSGAQIGTTESILFELI